MNWLSFFKPAKKQNEKPHISTSFSNTIKQLYPEEQDNLRYWRGFRPPDFQRNKANDLKINIEFEGEKEMVTEALGTITHLLPKTPPPKWQTDSDLIILEVDSKKASHGENTDFINREKFSSRRDLSYTAYKARAADVNNEAQFYTVRKFPSRTHLFENDTYTNPNISENIFSKGDFYNNNLKEKDTSVKSATDTKHKSQNKLRLVDKQTDRPIEATERAEKNAKRVFKSINNYNHKVETIFKDTSNKNVTPDIAQSGVSKPECNRPNQITTNDKHANILNYNNQNTERSVGLYFKSPADRHYNDESNVQQTNKQDESPHSPEYKNTFTKAVLTPKYKYKVRPRSVTTVPSYQKSSHQNSSICEVTNAKIPVHRPESYQTHGGIRVSLSESFRSNIIPSSYKLKAFQTSAPIFDKGTFSTTKFESSDTVLLPEPEKSRRNADSTKPPVPRSEKGANNMLSNAKPLLKSDSAKITESNISFGSKNVASVKEAQAPSIVEGDKPASGCITDTASQRNKLVNHAMDNNPRKTLRKPTGHYSKYDSSSQTNMYFSRNPTGGGYIMKMRSASQDKCNNAMPKNLQNGDLNENANNSTKYDIYLNKKGEFCSVCTKITETSYKYANSSSNQTCYSDNTDQSRLSSLQRSPLKFDISLQKCKQYCYTSHQNRKQQESFNLTKGINYTHTPVRMERNNVSARVKDRTPTIEKTQVKSNEKSGKRIAKDHPFLKFFIEFMNRSFPKNMPVRRFLTERDLDSGKSFPCLGNKRNNPCHRELNKIVWCFNHRNEDLTIRQVASAKNSFYNCVRLNNEYFYKSE